MQIATYVVQNLDAYLGVHASQTRGKSPTLLIHQDVSQDPNGFGFVGNVDNVLP